MFRVITFTHEFGSGGGVIAQSVAERLGWSLLDNSLIAAVARAAQVDLETAQRYDESVDSWWHRFHCGGLRCAAIEAGANPKEVRFYDGETIASFASAVIAEAAAKGQCVIVGRGAQCVLRSSPDAFHVFVCAPWAERVKRIRKRTGTNGDTEELLRSGDKLRARYIQRYFSCNWKDPNLYHMMINSQLGDDAVARLIACAVEDIGSAVKDAEIAALQRLFRE